MTTIHMRIVQNHELIADLPEWPGPVPRVGDYIFHPPSRPGDDESFANIAGSVKVVKWRILDRPGPDGGEFVMTARPYVEIAI